MCSDTLGCIQDPQEFLRSTRTQADTSKLPGAAQNHKGSCKTITVSSRIQRAVNMYSEQLFYTQEQVGLFKLTIGLSGPPERLSIIRRTQEHKKPLREWGSKNHLEPSEIASGK